MSIIIDPAGTLLTRTGRENVRLAFGNDCHIRYTARGTE